MYQDLFKYLSNAFEEKGFKIFAVGGLVRDELLGLELLDFDFATDATPDDMKIIIPKADYTFSKYGCVKFKGFGCKAEITTFRVEDDYIDFRHPGKIRFVKTIEEDYKRRDFTINAIYKDFSGNIYDPANGVNDLKNCIIRFIGDPEIRIKEDPLRILRAKRFEKKLNFKIEEKTNESIEKLAYLLDKLNPDKVKEETRKMNDK